MPSSVAAAAAKGVRQNSCQKRVLSMVTSMLDKAFEKIPDGTNLILHSD